MREIVVHGRAGQPVAATAEAIAAAALLDGKYSQTWRVFGITPIRGPISAVARVSPGYIRERGTARWEADCAVVLDPTLLRHIDPARGLKPGGIVLVAVRGGARPSVWRPGWQAVEVPDSPQAGPQALLLREIARRTGILTEGAVAAWLASAAPA